MENYCKLENGWFFTKEEQNEVPVDTFKDWQAINLPHTWNRFDGQDGGGDYYRGKCWYAKELDIPELKPGTQVYVEFQAASSRCEVYVNGVKATEHEGGYSLFRVNITSLLSTDKNILSVMVTNEHQEQIYPQMADFTFYGGLYREVNLIFVPETHFSLDFYGSTGMTASSTLTGDKEAEITLHAYVHEPKESDQVIFSIKDESGQIIANIARPAEEDTCVQLTLSDLHLWQGVIDPYLYEIETLLVRHNEVLDEIYTRHGFREFSVDPQKGFFLNGILTPLRGVSRHQDRLDQGNALTYEDHLEDALLIKELGANTIRLAHYQHSTDFYDLCDQLGFILWAEIPFISSMSEDPKAHQNCISQMKELIYQNYNHSSICFWGISNEITIGGVKEGLVDNLKELNDLVHELDPTRLSTMAQVSNLPIEDVQNQITDTVGYNHYFGWYAGDLADNEKWLDKFHEVHPDRALGISEYGCEGIITYHNENPKAGDYSEEYQALYHEHMAKIIDERPWLWGTHVWNMFDFGCDARNEGGVAGRNNKGLITIDRKVKKDSFYLYKAYWSQEPVLHICSKRYAKRSSESITVKVYSNQSEVELQVNGIPVGKQTGKHVFEFENILLKDKFTQIDAVSENLKDTTIFEKVNEPYAPYILIEDESETGVMNWFDDIDISEKKTLTFDERYFSIRNTMNEILESKEAATIVINAVSSIMGMRLKKSMLGVMGEQTLENLGSTISGASDKEIDVEAVESYINSELQKIKR
ncbi:glycoside hydrolase family 2 protein [Jeotgalibaca sp. MA1X17-3]|uniref:glycoside hydrolase family 2 protein n=1 Tax=Jeotgalibaca sp. MA1X17-3 TaxID=2908211 RepID=UPI001F1A5554|nr:glycoside hydrolase family 2 protein [Jeotgalibaca sp. MA1X17-3]UJF15536.1 glycoside hydrolase family 2 protein [Jeotgalibaca sp. MA1X17-3]